MKVLFFSPHAAIWVHAFPEALVAETLRQSGHEVVYVTCGEVLQDHCVAMSAFGLDSRSSLPERKRVCARCNANSAILRDRMALKGYEMAEVLTAEDYRQIDKIVTDLNDANYLQLQIEGVPVGRYALYELILQRKKSNIKLTSDEWREYKAAARGALVALFAGRRILERERPERLVTYNSLYAVNRVLSRLAEQRGITTYFLHAGGNLSRRLQTLMVGRDYTLRYMRHLIAEWPRFRDQPCPAALIEQITEHFLVLFGGESVFAYSSGAGKQSLDIRFRFGIRPDQRLLVATMSSPDERFAAQTIDALPSDDGLLFRTQVDWILALMRFVSTRPDLFLLIRVHPREFPNKRDRVESQHAALLANAFENLPQNARVNWPTDNIALYDIANYADVFLNAWSSAGKEMALLGIPVVAYSADLMLYPADLNYVAKSAEDFFAKIDQALDEGWSIERSRSVYRWLAVEYGYGLIDISDGYHQKERMPSRYIHIAVRKILDLFDRNYVQKRDCLDRPSQLAQHRDIEQTIRLGACTPLDTRVERHFPRQIDLQTEDKALRAALSHLGLVLFGRASHQFRGPLAQRLAAVGATLKAA